MKRIASRTTTMTSKGQVTIPVEIRRRLGLKPGDKVFFEDDGTNIRVLAGDHAMTFEDAYKSVPPLTKPRTWKEIQQIVADERAEAYARKWNR